MPAGKRGDCARRKRRDYSGCVNDPFRRYIDRYEEEGLQGLIDHRVGRISRRRAPVDEVMALTRAYGSRQMPTTTRSWAGSFNWYY